MPLPSRRPGRAPGFTLIELLVVIAIIAVLVGLMLPAVQKVRESAARAKCQNNLHNLAIAQHMHHDANGRLAYLFASDCCHGTWVVPILPFIEQKAMFELYQNYGGAPGSSPRHDASPNTDNVTQRRLAIATCPSDKENAPQGLTAHNYAVVVGNGSSAGLTVDAGRQNYGLLPGPPPYPTGYSVRAGMFDPGVPEYVWSAGVRKPAATKTKLTDVTDGLTNTVMMAEVRQGQGNDHRGLLWWASAAGVSTYYPPNTKSRDVTAGSCVDDPATGMPCTNGFPVTLSSRSKHSGGVNVALGDASVRFVRDSIAPDVWRAAGTIEGKTTEPAVNLD